MRRQVFLYMLYKASIDCGWALGLLSRGVNSAPYKCESAILLNARNIRDLDMYW